MNGDKIDEQIAGRIATITNLVLEAVLDGSDTGLTVHLREPTVNELVHVASTRGITAEQQAAAILDAWANRQRVNAQTPPVPQKIRRKVRSQQ